MFCSHILTSYIYVNNLKDLEPLVNDKLLTVPFIYIYTLLKQLSIQFYILIKLPHQKTYLKEHFDHDNILYYLHNAYNIL